MIALASCQQKEDFTLPVEGELMTFYASIMDDATKTTAQLDGNQTKVLWAAGDSYAMSVLGGDFAKFTLQGEGGETTGTFTGEATAGEGDKNIAYYPYAESSISLSGGKLNVVFPAEQAYTVDCIAAAPMVAVSTDNTLKFQNVASLIKITLKGTETITSISLKGNSGEALAGKAEVSLSEVPELTLTADAAEKSITLDCGEGIELSEEGVDFYFAVPSITLTKGFTVVATDSEEKAMIKSTTNEVALTASKVKVFPVFEYESNVEEVSTLEELKSALSNISIASIKLDGNLTTNETLTINRNIILNGDGNTLTYTGTDRAFQIIGGTVVINDLTVNMPETTPEDSRGINLYNGVTNEAIDVTVNNVTVNGHKAYAVNIGGGTNNKLTINNSTLTGYAAINVHTSSENHTITVNGSTLNGKNHNNSYHFGTVVVDGTNAHSLTITESHITTENLEGVTSKYYPVVVGANCTYNVCEGINVAVRNVYEETGGLYHIGLASAIKVDDAKIKLLANIELENMIAIPSGKTVTLDLQGKTLNNGAFSIVVGEGSTLNIESASSATIEGSGDIIVASKNSKINISAGVSLTSTANCCIFIPNGAENVTVTTAGNLLTSGGDYSAIYVNGNVKTGTINITGGEIEHISDVAVYIAGNVNVNISGNTAITGTTAIEQRAGNLTIDGGTFTATAESFTEVVNNNGTTTTGVAVAICQHNTQKETRAIINGGTFTGAKCVYMKPYDDTQSENVSLVVTGGTFENLDEIYLAEGYGLEFEANDDGTYDVIRYYEIDTDGAYVLSSAQGMFWFAREVNINNKTFSGNTIKLKNNIDLNNQPWTPIGQTGYTQFKGTFDGNGKTIYNLTIDTTNEENRGSNHSTGLFGWLNGATVRNLTIDGANISGSHNVAGIAGYLESSGCTVDNCHVKNAEISCTLYNNDLNGDKCGAIVAYANNSGVLVNNCTAENCTITASRDAGQIVGAGQESFVTNCSATKVKVSHNGTGTGTNINNNIIGRVL